MVFSIINPYVHGIFPQIFPQKETQPGVVVIPKAWRDDEFQWWDAQKNNA